jgi:D-alanine--poly(phosphoribitol) ligase subunit 1
MIPYTSAANLGQVADAALRHFSERPALWIQGRMLTYADLGELSRGMASAVLAHSTSSRRVAVLADRNEVGYAGILGALLAGMAYVPLNPRFSAARIVDILQQADVDAIVCDSRCKTILDSVEASLPPRLRVVVFDPGKNSPSASSPYSNHNLIDTSRDDTAYIMFTSGTTGKPKGVPVSHGNALSFLENIRNRVPPRADDRFLQILDLSFDPSLHDLFTCWTVGATLYSVPEGMATMADRFIRDFQITQFSAVASTAALLHAQGRLRSGVFSSLRDTIFGGEALPVGVAAAWRKAAPQSTVRNHYGPTEATVAITECLWNDAWEDELTGSVPIGEVFDGQTVLLVDDAMQPVGPETPGELVVSGSQVTHGYLNNPEATREKFVTLSGSDRLWYRTGDLVERHSVYGLRYRGRVDLQLKVRGFRVEGQEVESHVRAASGSDLVAVIGWPRDEQGLVTGLVAFVVGPKQSPEAIIESCRKRMPDYMVPSRIISVGNLPINANGKVDYAALGRSPALS